MARKRWGLIAGGATVAICIPLAILDGGISAFASLSALQAALGAGTLQIAEVSAALAAGKAVKTFVDGKTEGNEKKKENGAAQVKESAEETVKKQIEDGNVDKLVVKLVDERGKVVGKIASAISDCGTKVAKAIVSAAADSFTSLK